MITRLPGKHLHAFVLSLLLVSTALATAHGAPVAAPQEALRGIAAGTPASGMVLFLEPAGGGQPPYSLHRIYPDETGQAAVDFGTPLDVRNALISPDGSRFALYVIDAGNVGRIYLAAADGGTLDMLPLDATHMGLEDWHPSGSELLVWQFSNGQYDLARLSLDGQITNLTGTPGIDERDGRWAQDGNRFSFTSAGLGGAPDVYVQQVGGAATNITNSIEPEGPAEWSPGGGRLVYARNLSLIASDASGANSNTLSEDVELLAYGWSPTGEIYASDAEGDVGSAPDDGSNLTTLISLPPNSWVTDWGKAGTAPLVLTPDHVSIAVEQGAPDPAPVSVLVDSEDFVTPWSADSSASWLSVDPGDGETPEAIELSFSTSTLPAGLYAAPVTFLPGPRTLNVAVAINPPGSGSDLIVAPASMSFVGDVGGPHPEPATMTVSSTGQPVNWVASETAEWLSLSSTSGTSPSSVAASVDTSGLAAGSYQTTVTFQPGNRQVSVTLDLSPAGEQPQLTVSPPSLTFTADLNGPAPAPQSLSISHSGSTGIEWTAVTSADWLVLSSYSGVSPSIVDVIVDTTGLAAGQHTGTISINQQSIPVTLTVLDDQEPPPGPGPIAVSPSSLAMASISGGAAPGVKEIDLTSVTGQVESWTASASEPWLLLSEISGVTPATVKLRADVAALAPGAYTATVTIGSQTVAVTLHVIAGETPDPAVGTTWSRQDLAVQEGAINRTWLWGPFSNGTTIEPYAESPGGDRQVTYYDKSRMEITYPDADRGEVWFVTNGLLAFELITGQMQLGDNLFVQGEPSVIPVAGDADDETGPRYATFTTLLDAPPLEAGSTVLQTVDAAGNVGSESRFSAYGVTTGAADPQTGHTVASVFWDYLNQQGLIWNGVSYVQGPLFEPWFFATGLPITEPYWAQVKVGGIVQDVLVQCFERRCLTYTPANPTGWQVEQGNVGMHYFRWRYERPE